MKILGIETSCDETSSAVVVNGTKILSNVVASSKKIHSKTGGIIPENAARQQVKSIILVVSQALEQGCGFKFDYPQSAIDHSPVIDAIAVTIGPGLIGSLLVGVETAKSLSYIWKKPIIPVNHLVGHIYANWLSYPKNHTQYTTHKPPNFPALALVVSGGHTDLVFMKNHNKLKWLGGTLDDAAGEAFDKTARLLGLGYPGGPAISVEANKFLNHKLPTNHHLLKMFPRPMIKKDNYNFSFSGLKTSVLNHINKYKTLNTTQQLAAEIQESIVDCLVHKSKTAIRRYKPKSFLLAGGVAANERLRYKFRSAVQNMKGCTFHVAPADLCTDNAAFISAYAYFNYHPVTWKKITANSQLLITD